MCRREYYSRLLKEALVESACTHGIISVIKVKFQNTSENNKHVDLLDWTIINYRDRQSQKRVSLEVIHS